MLQRAASNAYSWWLASHIRTKQSKWLEQNLQDMEEQVQGVLKLIQEDGDSFAKRAEMYYKKRPEITSFVEESYKAYRALAERYDHISTELQNANNTIASVFPEQVEFAMDEDYEDGSPRARRKPTDAPKGNIPNVPNVPTKDLKGLLKSSAKKLRPNKPTKIGNPSVAAAVKSGLSKTEALKEIDGLQKGILALQTEKEFAKVSYERSLEKYWEIEERITGMHEKICKLQDEFGISAVIEDEEARTLMTSAALKSCQDTLAQLQEKQETSVMEARVEHQKIRDVREKLKALKDEFHCNGINEEDKDSDAKSNAVEVGETPNGLLEQEETAAAQGRELEKLREKIKEQLSAGGSASLTVTEMAQKVDEIVTKVVSLETAVSSQTALIRRLRAENDELQSQIGNLENDRVTTPTAGGEKNNVGSKIRKMEEKLNGVQDLNQSIKNQNNNLQTHFTEAHCNLDHLTKKLHSMKPDEEIPDIDSFREGEESITGIESQTESIEKKEFEVHEARLNPGSDFKGNKDQKTEVRDETVGSPPNVKPQGSRTDQDEEPNWRQLFLNGLEDREKVLLGEYTSVLRNYKEAKKKVGEVERKNQDSLRELESANAIKDEEIQSLRQKLTLLQGRLNDDINSKEAIDSDHKPSSNSPRNEESMDGKLMPTEEEGDNVTVILIDPPNNISAIEEKFRMKIDELLEQNLDFWLRFSTSFHQIQTYQTGIEDLQVELSKLTSKLEEKPEGGSHSGRHSLKSDARPIYKHLREIQTELSVWVEHSVLLKDELQCRFSSLCEIQEQISKESNEGSEEEHKLTGFQAAKFQGEVMNMKQENNKVADELQAGLDHVTGLQFEVEKTVAKLNEEFELVGSKNHSNSQFKHSTSRGRVPLRSFIFGAKAKPQKPSIFSCVQPVLHRKYNDLRAGLPTSLKSGSSRSKDA